MCCTWLTENSGCKESPKIRHLGTITQICRAVSLQLRHVSTLRKKLLSANTSSTCPHNMVNFSPLVAEIGSVVWGTPANFNGFHVLTALLQWRRSPEANQTLHDVWPSPGLLHYIYIFGGSSAWRNFARPDAKFTLCPSLAFSYIGSVTARHSSSARQPKFAAWYKEWNYTTFAQGATYIGLGGHHVWQQVSQPAVSCIRTFNSTGCQTGLTTS